jgi:hypothetical protein
MRNISVRIILAVLLVASLGCAKVLTAKTSNNFQRSYNKDFHGWVTSCELPEVTVKYNPKTDRGFIKFGRGCSDTDTSWTVLIRVYDSDGFQINAFSSEKVNPYHAYNIMATELTVKDREDARKIVIDFFSVDAEDYPLFHINLSCPSDREFNEDDGVCERICHGDKYYDKWSDKCLDLYDSKETAAYEPPDEPVDTQVADVSSYWPGYGPGYDTDNYKTDGNTYYDKWRKEQWKLEPDSDCPLNKMIGGRCQY